MRIGIPTEITPQEGRVAIIPSVARILTKAGHKVFIQQGAGQNSGLLDDEYIRAGAELCSTAEDIYERSQLIWKVQAPLPQELPLLRKGQILMAFLHLAYRQDLKNILIEKGIIPFAMETFKASDGSLPLLTPMSEIGGRLAVHIGARYLGQSEGLGILLGGVPGVPPAKVTIIGGGIAGRNAARDASAIGAEVRVLDTDDSALRWIDTYFRGQVRSLFFSPHSLEESLIWADLVIGAVHIVNKPAPILVTREQLGFMQPGAVVIDLAIDQGGCFETSSSMSFSEPTRTIDGIIHYSVPNLPGAVPRTSTFALCQATFPVLLKLANDEIFLGKAS